jgi:signal transduction histidine kinase
MGARDGSIAALAVLVVFILNGCVDLVLHLTRWSQRADVPIPVGEVLVRLYTSGLSVAGALLFVDAVFGADHPASNVAGLLVYPLLAVWVGAGIIIYLDVMSQARELRAMAVSARSRSVDVTARSAAAIAALRERIGGLVSPQLERLGNLAAGGSSTSMSAALRGVAEATAQSTGRHLWSSSDPQDLGRIGFGEILRGSLLRPEFRPMPIIGVAVLVPATELASDLRWEQGLIAALAAVLVVVECRIANRLIDRYSALSVFVVVGVVAVFSSQALIAERVGRQWDLTGAETGPIATVVMTLVLVGVTSSIGSYRHLDDRRAAALAAAISTERLDTAAQAHAVSVETRRLASLLHGRLQTRLLGCAMALEFADGDAEAVEAALERTRSILDEGWDPGGQAEGERTVDDVAAMWSGLAAVRIDVKTDRDVVADSRVVEVVEELVLNAVRHGRARTVEVRVSDEGEHIVIRAVDDGHGGDGRSGLGSQVLASVGVVDRVLGASGSSVTVRLDID